MPGPSDEHVACSLATLFVSSLREGKALVYGDCFTNVTQREHSFGARCLLHYKVLWSPPSCAVYSCSVATLYVTQ